MTQEKAKQIYEEWIEKSGFLPKTSVYRDFIAPAVSFVMEDATSGAFVVDKEDGHDYLQMRRTFFEKTVEIRVKDLGLGCLHFSIFIANSGFSCYKKLVDIQSINYAESLALVMKTIQNVTMPVNGMLAVDVSEAHRKTLFTPGGLEKERIEQVYTSPYPIFVKKLDEDTLLGLGENVLWYQVKKCPMHLENDIHLQVSDYYAPGALSISPFMDIPLAVCAKDGEKEMCFPYFHDEDGWIITSPFIEREQLQLPPIEAYPTKKEDLMNSCDEMAKKSYIDFLNAACVQLFERKKEAPGLSFRYDPKK